MTDNEEQGREPTNNVEILARAAWRRSIGDNTFDPEFWEHFDRLSSAGKADAAAIAKAAVERKPSILATRTMNGDIEAARRDFLAGGGTESEWSGMKAEVRHELLKKRALGEGRTLKHAEVLRRAAATGYTVWDPRNA